jgi:hypothetical protein
VTLQQERGAAGGLTQVRRDLMQLRIALNGARTVIANAAGDRRG